MPRPKAPKIGQWEKRPPDTVATMVEIQQLGVHVLVDRPAGESIQGQALDLAVRYLGPEPQQAAVDEIAKCLRLLWSAHYVREKVAAHRKQELRALKALRNTGQKYANLLYALPQWSGWVIDHELGRVNPERAFKSFCADLANEVCKWDWLLKHGQDALTRAQRGRGGRPRQQDRDDALRRLARLYHLHRPAGDDRLRFVKEALEHSRTVLDDRNLRRIIQQK